MDTPSALSWEQQIELLKCRGLVVENRDVTKIQNISYYRLKEFAQPFAKEKDGSVFYENITFHEVLGRYYQDKNLRIFLLHALEKIEVSLKTRISNLLGLKYGAFGYLNFSLWANKNKFSKFTIEQEQFRIKKNLLQVLRKSQLRELKNQKNLDSDNFPSVWLGIDLLMLGDVVKIVELMNTTHQKKLAKCYDCTPEELISWLGCLNLIRNICAHNSNLVDITLKTKPKSRPFWLEILSTVTTVAKDGTNIEKPSSKLAVVIMIIVELVIKINSKYQWNGIQGVIKNLCRDNDERAKLLGFKSCYIARKSIDILLCKRLGNEYCPIKSKHGKRRKKQEYKRKSKKDY